MTLKIQLSLNLLSLTKTILLQSACSCHEAEREVETKTHMKVIISPSGQPVIITQFDQKLRDLR